MRRLLPVQRRQQWFRRCYAVNHVLDPDLTTAYLSDAQASLNIGELATANRLSLGAQGYPRATMVDGTSIPWNFLKFSRSSGVTAQ